MDATTLVEKLKTRFSDAAVSLTTDNPDPFVVIDRNKLVEIADFLRHDVDFEFDFLTSVTGVDLKDKLQVVYHLWSYKHRHGLVLKVDVPQDDVRVPSVMGIWRAANWLEREQYDLFGFEFVGHKDLRRIMLPADWVGYPLRKDYVFPTEYHGVSHHRPSPFDGFKALDEQQAQTAKQVEPSGAASTEKAPS